MDVRDLKFDDETFDVCLDKGTLDCFACGEDAATEVSTMLKEVNRVLKPGRLLATPMALSFLHC